MKPFRFDRISFWLLLPVLVMSIAACTTRPTEVNPGLGMPYPTNTSQASVATAAAVAAGPQVVSNPTVDDVTVSYTLKTIIGTEPAMAFIGVGGDIDGVINPQLDAEVGDVVQITVINGDPIMHNFHITEFGVATPDLMTLDEQAVVIFQVTAPGDFLYFCAVPGHQQAGMQGTLRVTGEVAIGNPIALASASAAMPAAAATAAPADPNAVSIIRSPADVPSPVGNREPQTLRIEMTAIEVTGQLADGTTYSYFTFDGKVPGPMLRVRLGDTVEFTLKNADGSAFPHSIDLHAVTGPGGGAVFTQTKPGEHTVFTFKAINPGLYVYHCATSSIPHHISNGMYGLILVEPEGGLPPVDREFYVMQGELYTVQPFGTAGHLDFDADKLSHEEPEYFVFNGAAGGLTSDENALRANVGETVRIFFGVGGPNFVSSFHVIGEIFDRVYDQASLTSPALTNVQTTLVPPGGATMVEFTLDVPGRYILVDHSLSRLERGLAGYLYAEGDENPDIFHGEGLAESAGH
ncbi:MAG: nitrite reductase, copper-containing [Anaerolineae bacterium]|nr:nitrite reductase, copper-containing [Anaerolineae bacterium]